MGRVTLFEMLHMDDHLRELVSRGAPAHQLKEEAVAGGMGTLLDHGLQLARSGEASLMEVASVVSD